MSAPAPPPAVAQQVAVAVQPKHVSAVYAGAAILLGGAALWSLKQLSSIGDSYGTSGGGGACGGATSTWSYVFIGSAVGLVLVVAFWAHSASKLHAEHKIQQSAALAAPTEPQAPRAYPAEPARAPQAQPAYNWSYWPPAAAPPPAAPPASAPPPAAPPAAAPPPAAPPPAAPPADGLQPAAPPPDALQPAAPPADARPPAAPPADAPPPAAPPVGS